MNMVDFFNRLESIDNEIGKRIIDEMFIQGNIEDLSYREIIDYLVDLKKCDPSSEDIFLIENIFKEFAQKHYYNSEYGIIIMMSFGMMSCDKESKKTKYNTYLLKNPITSHFKIGKTSRKDISIRVKELSVGAELEIISFCAVDIESNLHKKYAHKRVHREWFDLNDNDVKNIINEFNGGL